MKTVLKSWLCDLAGAIDIKKYLNILPSTSSRLIRYDQIDRYHDTCPFGIEEAATVWIPDHEEYGQFIPGCNVQVWYECQCECHRKEPQSI